MKFNKYLPLAIISIFVFPDLTQKALALECPFDSYMIIGGKCHNMTQEKSPPTVHKTIYRDSYKSNEEDFAFESLKKECRDFAYQESAQYYFDRNPEQKHLDSDRKRDLLLRLSAARASSRRLCL